MKKVNPFLGADDLAKLLATAAGGETIVRKVLQSLSDKERKHILKMKPGGQQVIPLISKLVAEYGLSVQGASSDEMEQAATSATGLANVKTALVSLTKSVDDTRLNAESVAWGHALLFYSLLNHVAQKNPKLADAMKPIQQVFTRRSPEVLEQRAIARAARERDQAQKKADKAAAKEEARKAAQLKKLAAKGVTPPATPANTTPQDSGATQSSNTTNGTPPATK
jgi:hypothetical protein